MTILPEWAKWVARDMNGILTAFSHKPKKVGFIWKFDEGACTNINETDDTFSHIEWTDEQPTSVKSLVKEFSDKAESLRELGESLTRNWEAEHGKPSVEEYNQWQITQAKAHGYDEPPIMSDYDMVAKPKHYIGVYGLEVEEVLQNFLPKITDGYVAHRVGSLIEYVLRHPEKNGCEDLEKAQRNLKQVFDYYNLKG